ncbi:unnamed protein product [[Actinomadura] parvosata subsp. kistnae]|uniref:hypothetical protein n=1 Tax=[Actinomadura] parvosata TaxID=1955412 RepID=UPI000D2730B0|nr:unnamed protein product [Actinomadura parvosata subsp. kistnae]
MDRAELRDGQPLGLRPLQPVGLQRVGGVDQAVACLDDEIALGAVRTAQGAVELGHVVVDEHGSSLRNAI